MRGTPKYSCTVRGDTLVWTFADAAATKIEFDCGTLNARQAAHFRRHGVKQTGVDTMAGKNMADSIKQLRRVIDGLKRGLIGMVGMDIDLLVAAIAQVTGLDADAVKTKVDASDDAKLQEWASTPKIAAAMATLDATRKQAEAQKDTTEFTF